LLTWKQQERNPAASASHAMKIIRTMRLQTRAPNICRGHTVVIDDERISPEK
jgi:hypothetical protein